MSGDAGLLYGLRVQRLSKAGIKIRNVISDIRQQGYSRTKPFPIGKVERRMEIFAANNRITLSSQQIYMSSQSIFHGTRQFKQRIGKAVSNKELEAFPIKRRQMELYYEKSANTFIYLDRPKKAKYIIEPNREIKIDRKKKRKVMFVTATRMKSNENFNGNNSKYVKI